MIISADAAHQRALCNESLSGLVKPIILWAMESGSDTERIEQIVDVFRDDFPESMVGRWNAH